MRPKTFACDLLRLGTHTATRFCQSAMLVTEEDIAFSLEKLGRYDLFFFFGFLWPFDTFMLLLTPLHSAPLALSSHTYP